jgi:hypothetical protein
VAIEEYTLVGEGSRPLGIGLRLQDGLIQLIPPDNMLNAFADPAARTLTFRGSGWGMAAGTFDAVEQQQIAVATRNFETRGASQSMTIQAGGGQVSAGLVGGSMPSAPLPATGPVRVGGSIRTPQKTVDAPPVLPELARQAGVRGVVIIEATVAADGTVAFVG